MTPSAGDNVPRLRKPFARWLDDISLDLEDRFVDHLQRSGRALIVDNVVVYTQECFGRHFECDTATCDPGLVKGLRSCCNHLHVDLTRAEIDSIQQLLPAIVRVMEAGDQSPGLKLLAAEENGFVEMSEDFVPQLAKHKWGCVFAYREKGEAFQCAVHAAALAEGTKVSAVKPKICSFWPLVLIEYDDDQYLLTALTDETGVLLDDDEKHDRFPCLRDDDKGPPLYKEFAPLLVEMFGHKFVSKLDRAYEEWSAARAGVE